MQGLKPIRAVKRDREDEILSHAGVTGVDVGPKIVAGEKTDVLSIRVYVAKKQDVSDEERIPEEIDGIPTDVIERSFKPMLMAPVEEIMPTTDAGRYDTVQGGVSMGPCRSVFLRPPDAPAPGRYVFVGTLGCLVKDNQTGEPMALTNFHVAAVNDTWSEGDTMTQPSLVDGGQCGADVFGSLSRAEVKGRTGLRKPGVDAAVVRLDGSRASEASIAQVGDVRGTAEAKIGDVVRKRGRTTELTWGVVSSLDLTVQVPYPKGVGRILFRDQIGIDVHPDRSEVIGISGDSGSVVVNDTNEVVALFFASNTERVDDQGNVVEAEGTFGIASPISAVEDALDVKVWERSAKRHDEDEGDQGLSPEQPQPCDNIDIAAALSLLDARLARLESQLGLLTYVVGRDVAEMATSGNGTRPRG